MGIGCVPLGRFSLLQYGVARPLPHGRHSES
jgi:hypothetical protein